jgi:Ca2+-binding EF-hand superfamily protein
MDITLSHRQYLNMGLTFAIKYFEDVKTQYKKMFNKFDIDGDGTIDFNEFFTIIKTLDTNAKEWKILAMFSGMIDGPPGTKLDKSEIKFEQFLHAALHHELMDGLIDLFKKTDFDASNPMIKL